MGKYVDEFLYRGRPEGSEELPSWHMIIGAKSVGGFGADRTDYSEALTPAQAEAAGFKLDEIITGINLEALKTADDLRARVAFLEGQIENYNKLNGENNLTA